MYQQVIFLFIILWDTTAPSQAAHHLVLIVIVVICLLPSLHNLLLRFSYSLGGVHVHGRDLRHLHCGQHIEWPLRHPYRLSCWGRPGLPWHAVQRLRGPANALLPHLRRAAGSWLCFDLHSIHGDCGSLLQEEVSTCQWDNRAGQCWLHSALLPGAASSAREGGAEVLSAVSERHALPADPLRSDLETTCRAGEERPGPRQRDLVPVAAGTVQRHHLA